VAVNARVSVSDGGACRVGSDVALDQAWVLPLTNGSGLRVIHRKNFFVLVFGEFGRLGEVGVGDMQVALDLVQWTGAGRMAHTWHS